MNFYLKYFSMFMGIFYCSAGVLLFMTHFWDIPIKVAAALFCLAYGVFRIYRAYKTIRQANNE